MNSKLIRKLKKRLKLARNRLKSEALKAERARKRRDYWRNAIRNLEERLGLANEGQIEFPIDETPKEQQ